MIPLQAPGAPEEACATPPSWRWRWRWQSRGTSRAGAAKARVPTKNSGL